MVGAGLIAVAGGAADVGLGLWQEQQVTRQWQREVGGPPAPTGQPAPVGQPPPTGRPVNGGGTGGTARHQASDAVFALWIPALGYYAAVRQGVGGSVLAGGPGHYPTTAWPGQPGTVGVAAHNTFWIAFDRLKPGDEIVLQTRTGSYRYRVSAIRIVAADDRSLFPARTEHRLALTTCWPLWAGALAPRRLAIVADER